MTGGLNGFRNLRSPCVTVVRTARWDVVDETTGPRRTLIEDLLGGRLGTDTKKKTPFVLIRFSKQKFSLDKTITPGLEEGILVLEKRYKS